MESKMETESSSKEDIVDAIREGLRERSTAERKEHRAVALNKRRAALGDMIDDASYTVEFVAEKALALKKKTLSLQDYRHLPNALIQNEENVAAFLKTDHVLYSLRRDLSGHNQALQLYAASCCCNLALGNTKACTAITKKLAPHLITELDSLNRPLLELCTWTIGNLVAESSTAFDILYAQGCVKYIISLIRDCDTTILPSVIYTAMHCVRTGFNVISESEMIELVQVTVERNFLYKDTCYIWLLAVLSSVPACNSYLHSIIPRLVDYLYENAVNNFISVIEVTASVRILANTVCESSGEVAHILLENPKYTRSDMQELLNKLLSHQYIHVRKETLWLIGNLYNHNSAHVQETIKDVLPHLSYLKQAVLSLSPQFV